MGISGAAASSEDELVYDYHRRFHFDVFASEKASGVPT